MTETTYTPPPMALIQNWHDECLRFAQSIGNGDA